jgi:hypothetical protein
MANRQGVGKSTISDIWRIRHLQPRRVKSYRFSRDAKSLEGLTDVVGLNLNSPQGGHGALPQ